MASGSQYGFNNVEPMSREQKQAMGDKNAREKLLLAQRGAHEGAQAPGNVIVPNPNSPLYLDPFDRFAQPNAAALDAQRRAQERKAKEVRGWATGCLHPCLQELCTCGPFQGP